MKPMDRRARSTSSAVSPRSAKAPLSPAFPPVTRLDRAGRCRSASAFALSRHRAQRSSWRSHPLSNGRRKLEAVSRVPDPGSRVIHLIGICGTAMATLAALLKRRGYDVRGSDQNVYPPMSDFLAAEGIPIMTGYAADHIGNEVDLAVVGNAISRGNAELESVLERKIRYCSLPEAVRDHFLWGARSIVVAGTHGKTCLLYTSPSPRDS